VPLGVAVALLLSSGVAAAADWAAPEQRAGVLAWTLDGQPGRVGGGNARHCVHGFAITARLPARATA